MTRHGSKVRSWTRISLALAAAATLLWGCSVTLSSLEGRKCDATHACLSGYQCVSARCITPDGGTNTGNYNLRAPPGLCSADGWCFDQPVPQAEDIYALRVASPTDVTAVGAGGLIMRYDGGSWGREASGLTSGLRSLYVESADSAWAVGDLGVILHRDGGTWTRVPGAGTNDLYAVSGFGGKVVVAGGAGALLAWNGAAFVAQDAGTASTLTGAFSFSPTSSLLVGAGGDQVSYNGTYGTATAVTTDSFSGLWAATASDIWATGADGGLFHRDGGQWLGVASGVNEDLYRVWGSSSEDVWAVGNNSTVLHYNGTAWAPSVAVQLSTALDVHGSSASNVWVGGRGGVLASFNGSSWSPEQDGSLDYFSDVWGTDPTNVWVAGTFFGSLRHFDGQSWSSFSVPGLTVAGSGPTAIWGSGSGDVWAVTGAGRFLHFQGSTWQALPVTSSNPLRAISGTAANDVWAVGDFGTAYHYDGQAWTQVGTPNTLTNLSGVVAFSPQDVWAVGAAGTALHWDGGAWGPVSSGETANLHGVAGLQSNDVWAVGGNAVHHWNGTSWALAQDAGTLSLLHVFANSATDVYATSADGVLLHYDGTKWAVQQAGANGLELTSAYGFGPGLMFVVGNGGVVLRQGP